MKENLYYEILQENSLGLRQRALELEIEMSLVETYNRNSDKDTKKMIMYLLEKYQTRAEVIDVPF